jgi:hypothetical protein
MALVDYSDSEVEDENDGGEAQGCTDSPRALQPTTSTPVVPRSILVYCAHKHARRSIAARRSEKGDASCSWKLAHACLPRM